LFGLVATQLIIANRGWLGAGDGCARPPVYGEWKPFAREAARAHIVSAVVVRVVVVVVVARVVVVVVRMAAALDSGQC
jgi:hypothetical protein